MAAESIFFVSCPLHFESDLVVEIESFWFQLMDLDGLPTREISPEFVIHPGGVEFKTSLHLGLQINFFSKIALRVLLRINSFEARYFDQFEKGMASINLERYIDSHKINMQIESSKSRLFHEGNLLEASLKALSRKKIIYDKDSDFSLFVRLVKDRVIVSLDTTGEHLHFRGYRRHQGEAPIRENLAALILQMSQLNVYADQVLFDPYCGSGTFFFEAQLKNSPVLNRNYTFLKFKIVPALFKSETWKKNYRWVSYSKKLSYLGIEKKEETFQKALSNQNEFQKIFSPVKMDLICADSEKISLDKIQALTGVKKINIVTNPPYGERSHQGEVAKSLKRFEDLDQLSSIMIIHPVGWRFQFKKAEKIFEKPLSNQGLKTQVSFFSVNN